MGVGQADGVLLRLAWCLHESCKRALEDGGGVWKHAHAGVALDQASLALSELQDQRHLIDTRIYVHQALVHLRECASQLGMEESYWQTLYSESAALLGRELILPDTNNDSDTERLQQLLDVLEMRDLKRMPLVDEHIARETQSRLWRLRLRLLERPHNVSPHIHKRIHDNIVVCLCVLGEVLQLDDVWLDTMAASHSGRSCWNLMLDAIPHKEASSPVLSVLDASDDGAFQRALGLALVLEVTHSDALEDNWNGDRFLWRKCAWNLLQPDGPGSCLLMATSMLFLDAGISSFRSTEQWRNACGQAESVSTVSELLSALSASLLPSTLPQWSSHKWEWDLELRQCIGSDDDNAADICISRLLMRLEEQIRPQAFESHSNWSLHIQKWSQPLLNIQYRNGGSRVGEAMLLLDQRLYSSNLLKSWRDSRREEWKRDVVRMSNDVHSLSSLLSEYESVLEYEAMSDDWNSQRDLWGTALHTTTAPAALAVSLLHLEKNLQQTAFILKSSAYGPLSPRLKWQAQVRALVLECESGRVAELKCSVLSLLESISTTSWSVEVSAELPLILRRVMQSRTSTQLSSTLAFALNALAQPPAMSRTWKHTLQTGASAFLVSTCVLSLEERLSSLHLLDDSWKRDKFNSFQDTVQNVRRQQAANVELRCLKMCLQQAERRLVVSDARSHWWSCRVWWRRNLVLQSSTRQLLLYLNLFLSAFPDTMLPPILPVLISHLLKRSDNRQPACSSLAALLLSVSSLLQPSIERQSAEWRVWRLVLLQIALGDDEGRLSLLKLQVGKIVGPRALLHALAHTSSYKALRQFCKGVQEDSATALDEDDVISSILQRRLRCCVCVEDRQVLIALLPTATARSSAIEALTTALDFLQENLVHAQQSSEGGDMDRSFVHLQHRLLRMSEMEFSEQWQPHAKRWKAAVQQASSALASPLRTLGALKCSQQETTETFATFCEAWELILHNLIVQANKDVYSVLRSIYEDGLDSGALCVSNESCVYDELLVTGVYRAFDAEHLDAASAVSLTDLGMGVGKLLIQLFLQYSNLRKVIGVEQSESRFRVARSALLKLASLKRDLEVTVNEAHLVALSDGAGRVMEFRWGNLFHCIDGVRSDLLVVNVFLSPRDYQRLGGFLLESQRGCRLLLSRPKLPSRVQQCFSPLPSSALDSDRFESSWSPINGHRLFMFERTD